MLASACDATHAICVRPPTAQTAPSASHSSTSTGRVTWAMAETRIAGHRSGWARRGRRSREVCQTRPTPVIGLTSARTQHVRQRLLSRGHADDLLRGDRAPSALQRGAQVTPGPASGAQIPRPGLFCTVRNRRGVVAGVEPFDGESGRLHLVHVEYKDDQHPVEEQLLWELEPHKLLLDQVGGGDAAAQRGEVAWHRAPGEAAATLDPSGIRASSWSGPSSPWRLGRPRSRSARPGEPAAAVVLPVVLPAAIVLQRAADRSRTAGGAPRGRLRRPAAARGSRTSLRPGAR